MKKMTDYMKIREAAQFLGVCSETLRNWEKQGKLRTYRHPTNNWRLYKQSDLEKVLEGITAPNSNK